jgi:hypothetical protein
MRLRLKAYGDESEYLDEAFKMILSKFSQVTSQPPLLAYARQEQQKDPPKWRISVSDVYCSRLSRKNAIPAIATEITTPIANVICGVLQGAMAACARGPSMTASEMAEPRIPMI